MAKEISIAINQDMLEAFQLMTNSCHQEIKENANLFIQSGTKLLQEGLFQGPNAEVVQEAVKSMQNLVQLSVQRISKADEAATKMAGKFGEINAKTNRTLEENRAAFLNAKAKAANPDA